MKKSPLTHRMHARWASFRHGRPSEKLHVILVAGTAGKTTTCHLLGTLLREAGHTPLMLTHHIKDSPWNDYATNISTLQKALSHATQMDYKYAIVEADDTFLPLLAGTTFTVGTLVALNDCLYTRDLMTLEPEFAVVPKGMPTNQLDDHHTMTFGEQEGAEMQIVDTKLFRKGTEITLKVDHHNTLEVATHLVGRINARNVAAALATMYILSMDTASFADGIAELTDVPGNYSYITSDMPYTIAADRGYTDEAIQALLEDSKQLAKRRLIVATDIIPDDTTLQAYLDNCDRIIMTGGANHQRITTANSLEEAASLAYRGARQDDLVVFIGEQFINEDADGMTIVSSELER